MHYIMKYTIITTFLVVLTASIGFAGNLRSETINPDVTKIEVGQELYNQKTHPAEYCLAQNIYYESRTDNIAGQAAVADVVLNRVLDERWPNNICDVIYQGPKYESWNTKKDPNLSDEERIYFPVRNRCQFSWYCDGKPDQPRNEDAWRKAQELAYQMIHFRKFRGISEGSTHYHATYVNPKWNRNMRMIGRIGLHIFYVQR